jgi:hypothetical protein
MNNTNTQKKEESRQEILSVLESLRMEEMSYDIKTGPISEEFNKRVIVRNLLVKELNQKIEEIKKRYE